MGIEGMLLAHLISGACCIPKTHVFYKGRARRTKPVHLIVSLRLLKRIGRHSTTTRMKNCLAKALTLKLSITDVTGTGTTHKRHIAQRNFYFLKFRIMCFWSPIEVVQLDRQWATLRYRDIDGASRNTHSANVRMPQKWSKGTTACKNRHTKKDHGTEDFSQVFRNIHTRYSETAITQGSTEWQMQEKY